MKLLCSKFLYIFLSFLVIFQPMNVLASSHDLDGENMESEDITLQLLAVNIFAEALDHAESLENGRYRISMAKFGFRVFILFLIDLKYKDQNASSIIDRYQEIYNLEVSNALKNQASQLQYVLRHSGLTFFTEEGQEIHFLNHHGFFNEYAYSDVSQIHIDLDRLNFIINKAHLMNGYPPRLTDQNYHLNTVIDNELNMNSKLFASYQFGTYLFVDTDTLLKNGKNHCLLPLINEVDREILIQRKKLKMFLKNLYRPFKSLVTTFPVTTVPRMNTRVFRSNGRPSIIELTAREFKKVRREIQNTRNMLVKFR